MHTITNSIKDQKFFTLGRAVFTVSNPGGERYTFKISKPKTKDIFFANLVNGSQSGNAYLGVYSPDTNTVRSTFKSVYKTGEKPFEVLAWALRATANQSIPAGYAIQHEGKCGRCGRELTTPESIEAGIGPECLKHIQHTTIKTEGGSK